MKIIEFHAKWHPKSAELSRLLSEIVKESDTPIELTQYDIDECQDILEDYSVRCVPTVLIINNDGALCDRFSNTPSREVLIDKINKFKNS